MRLRTCARIADHYVWFQTDSSEHHMFVQRAFSVVEDPASILFRCDLDVTIIDQSVGPFVDFAVDIHRMENHVVYGRSDYRLEVDPDYREATLYVDSLLALKHALMNLYSTFIVHHNWGLLIHSSCVMDGDSVHLFAGPSGAGKSTIARLSHPRLLLSDEATVLRIRDDEVHVFDSPFRSDVLPATYQSKSYVLSSINLLHQSRSVHRERLLAAEAMIRLMDKVFYWPEGSNDSSQTIRLVNRLVQQVPTYQLYFEKSPSFWEAIS